MKSSKKFGKTLLAVVLSAVLMVSVIAPLTAIGSENNGNGATGTPLGQYRYYSVKSGETMQSIANRNGITISDIMTYNGLSSNSAIYAGQILKLPLTSKNQSVGLTTSTITIKGKDVDIKSLVSAIAANAGYTVIFKGQSAKVNIDLENVTPLRAIDYATRLVDLSYLKDGNTILVATASELNSTFVDSLVLSHFTFKYITYNELVQQANAMGLSNMKIVSQSNNGRDVWISAYPKEMAKLHELAEILDTESNVMQGSEAAISNFTPIKLNYLTGDEFSSLLESLGIHSGVTMPSHPQTLFVYASGQQLAEIMRIKAIVDTYDAVNAPADSTVGDSSGENVTTIVSGGNTVIKLDLVNISKSDAEAILSKSDYADTVSSYGHERMLKSIWLMGPTNDVNAVKAAIESFDSGVVSAASTIHTYEAQNCTVAELMNRIANLDLEDGVRFYQYDHPELASTIICYCDDITWNNEVYGALVAADTVDTGTKLWIPIASKTGTNSALNLAYTQNTISLMTELYPELFGGVQIRYETFVVEDPQINEETGVRTGGSYKVVVYAYTTSDAATRMTNCIGALESV